MDNMISNLVQIEFHFPANTENMKSKHELVDLIVDNMRECGSTKYSGHLDEESLRASIVRYIGDANIENYRKPNKSQRDIIEKKIKETVIKCNQVLSVPTKNYIFVLPYLPTEKDKVFDGTMGVACYSCVFYIFISLDKWTQKSLANTVAHELNHTIYYYHHYSNFGDYTLLDEIVLEGLAENFREQVIDSTASAWATALSKYDALNILKSVNDILLSKDSELIKKFLFGCSDYKKWTGYSVGYWLVKEFIKNNKNLLWEEVMRINSTDILDSIDEN